MHNDRKESLSAAQRPGRLDYIEACLQEARESTQQQPSKKRKVAGEKRPQERSSEALSSSAGLREYAKADEAREEAARAAARLPEEYPPQRFGRVLDVEARGGVSIEPSLYGVCNMRIGRRSKGCAATYIQCMHTCIQGLRS